MENVRKNIVNPMGKLMGSIAYSNMMLADVIRNRLKSSVRNVLFIEEEYYCNNCNSYFDAESQGVGYPSCPYCGSDNVSDF